MLQNRFFPCECSKSWQEVMSFSIWQCFFRFDSETASWSWHRILSPGFQTQIPLPKYSKMVPKWRTLEDCVLLLDNLLDMSSCSVWLIDSLNTLYFYPDLKRPAIYTPRLVLKIWIYFNFSPYLAWSVLVSQILTWAYRSLIVARTKTMRINLWLSRSLGASILSETHLSEHMESALASPQETLSYSRFCFFVLLSLRHETLIKWLGLRCEDVTTKSWFCVAILTWWL